MGIYQHLKKFAGRPVRFYQPGKKRKASRSGARPAYRVGIRPYEEGAPSFPELLDQFLTEHGGGKLTTLVIGTWNYDDMAVTGRGAQDVIEALVAARERMPNLKHLFFGDITGEECEISWISHGDISPLLPAFPKLQEFRIRGGSNLSFGKIKHNRLKVFAIESGGLPAALLEEVWKAKLPKLEHLELWLGTPSYGGMSDAEPLKPLLSGKRFPKLRYLGLRDCEIADVVAKAVAASPLLERLHVLDLSLGAVGDAGAEALIGSAAVRKLKKPDLHHHYLSSRFMEQLKQLPIEVDVGDQRAPEFWTYGDTTEVWRYITVSE